MNILITGIHGFVGSNLVEALREEHTIYGLDIVTPEKPGVLKTFGWSDLAVIPPMDVVIHLAGVAHDTKNRTEAQRYYDVNTGLTQKVFDWFQTTEAKKFIFFSSVKAAADQLFDKVLTEDVIPTPVGPYGESKIAAENYVLGLQLEAKNRLLAEYEQHEVITKVQTVYILRPCMIHGPGNKGNLNLLFNFVRSGIPYPLGAFENKRSFTSVDNMTYVIERMIALPIPGGIYNIGDDDQVSTNEIIELIAESINKKARIWKLPRLLLHFFASIGSVLHISVFNRDRLQKLTENYVVSNSKIKKAIGISRMPVNARDGFRKTFKSFSK